MCPLSTTPNLSSKEVRYFTQMHHLGHQPVRDGREWVLLVRSDFRITTPDGVPLGRVQARGLYEGFWPLTTQPTKPITSASCPPAKPSSSPGGPVLGKGGRASLPPSSGRGCNNNSGTPNGDSIVNDQRVAILTNWSCSGSFW